MVKQRKTLDRMFDAAERCSAILFFCVADALFGKRARVANSYDRYANIEAAYLLQRMEGHPSIVILATNLDQNLDHAFVRRIRFVVDFPIPENEGRKHIWDKALR